MVRALTLALIVAVAALFWVAVPLERLFDAFQPMVVALSIIIAAIFVRLNRGMPTLEWKSLERQKRTELTARIVELSREYVMIVGINGLTLISLVTLVVVGKDNAIKEISPLIQKFFVSFIGGMFSLCVARMAYVVWRDCDIMELQKYLIDNAAEREEKEQNIKLSDAKISEMKNTKLEK